MGDYATVAFEISGDEKDKTHPAVVAARDEADHIEESVSTERFVLEGETCPVMEGAEGLAALCEDLRDAGVSYTFRDMENTDDADPKERTWRPGWKKERTRVAHRGNSIGLDKSTLRHMEHRSDLELGAFVRNYFMDHDTYSETAVEAWEEGQPIVRFSIDETGKRDITMLNVAGYMNTNAGYEDTALGQLVAMGRYGRFDDSSEQHSATPYWCFYSVAPSDKNRLVEQLDGWFKDQRDAMTELHGDEFANDVKLAVSAIRGETRG